MKAEMEMKIKFGKPINLPFTPQESTVKKSYRKYQYQASIGDRKLIIIRDFSHGCFDDDDGITISRQDCCGGDKSQNQEYCQ